MSLSIDGGYELKVSSAFGEYFCFESKSYFVLTIGVI